MPSALTHPLAGGGMSTPSIMTFINMREQGLKNPGRPWPGEREGPATKSWEGFSFSIPVPVFLLPKEIVEWVATGVDFGYHLVEVSTKFVDTDLLTCRNEDARSVFLSDPTVLELIKSVVFLSLRLK